MKEGALFAIDHLHLMAVTRRSLGRALAIICMALLAVLVPIALAPPRYSATAKVFVEQLQPRAVTDHVRFLDGQVEVLGSAEIATRAVDSGGLASDPRFFTALGSRIPSASTSNRRREAARLILRSLMVHEDEAKGVIAIGVTSSDPQMSARIANALANAYIDSDDLRELDPVSRALRKSLADELRSTHAELSASQRELERQLLIEQPAGDLPVGDSSLVLASSRSSQATADRIAAESRWRMITAEPTPAASRPEFDRQIEAIGETIRADYRQAQEREEILNRHGNEQLALALAAYDSNIRTDALKREVDISRARYESLLDQSNALAARVLSTDAVLFEAARPAQRPVAPDVVIPVLAALAAGLATAAAVIFIRAISEDRLRGPSDVETKLGLPLLGLFPPDWNPANTATCRSLVANLEFAGAGSCPQSLVVASARPDEGATAIARAVAENLARNGVRVLLIDTCREDSGRRRRNPDASGSATISRSGNAVLDRFVTQDMTATSPSHLDSRYLTRMVEQAASRFDAVIVNAHPVLASRSAAAWAGVCDGTLLVVGTSGNRRGSVSRTNRCKRLIGPSILGVVLTGFDAKLPSGSWALPKITPRLQERDETVARRLEPT